MLATLSSFVTFPYLLAALGAFLLGVAKSGVKGIAVFIVILFVFAFGAKASTGILMPLLIGGYFRHHLLQKTRPLEVCFYPNSLDDSRGGTRHLLR